MAQEYTTGASMVMGRDDPILVPEMSLRDYFALHAPPPPNWWKYRTPIDAAMWCWTWADAMVKARTMQTTPESALTPGVNRP